MSLKREKKEKKLDQYFPNFEKNASKLIKNRLDAVGIS